MIVFAHVTGQRRGSGADLDLLRAALVCQDDEGVEADVLRSRGTDRRAWEDRGARRIGSPPVVCRRNGCTAGTILVEEIVSAGNLGNIACKTAEANGRRHPGGAHVHAAPDAGAGARGPGRIVPRNRNLRQGGARAGISAVVPDAAAGCSRSVVADDGALIDGQRGSGKDAAARTGGLVICDGAAVNLQQFVQIPAANLPNAAADS